MRTDLANHYAVHDLLAGILAESTGQYRQLFAAAFPGDIQYRWLVEGVEPSSEQLAEGLGNLVASSGFSAAVNAELAYCGYLTYWLRQSRARADSILTKMDGFYPRQ